VATGDRRERRIGTRRGRLPAGGRKSDRWTADDIVDLTGKTALVTGANSGIGLHTALELATHGAHVILGCRSRQRAERAVGQMMALDEDISVEVLEIDLSSQASVHAAAERVLDGHARLDVLVHNAGVMGTPFRLTEDGVELQVATNHLGPFTLTGLLLDLLVSTDRSRVVTVSSVMHRLGSLERLERLSRELRETSPSSSRRRVPSPWLVYGDTKLANLAFTYELERRFRAAETTTIAVAAHPGWARTELVANGPLFAAGGRSPAGRLAGHLGQPAATGALPSLYAAAAPGVAGGDYYGPRGAGGLFGPPARARSSRSSHDPAAAARLWQMSEDLSGVRFDFTVPAAPAGRAGRGEAADAVRPVASPGEMPA
jgi:NAD(P)-dependent dehydrogenase (short-subunit alcohol dehydrogenase family)